MFESSLIESRRERRARGRLLTLPVAVAAHCLGLAAVVAGQLWAIDELSEPFTVVAFVLPAAAPPAGPAEPPSGPRDENAKPRAPAVAQPTIVPDEVPSLPEGEPETVEEHTGPTVPGGMPGEGGEGGGTGTGQGGSGDRVGPVQPEREHGPYVLSADIEAPVALERTPPAYPEVARTLRRQGIVVVEAVVGEDGRVRSVRPVSDAVGYGAAENAQAAVLRWRYRPARLNGRPVAVVMQVTITFTIN